MANRILTSSGFVEGPDFEQEEDLMAEQSQQWPRTLFSKDEQQNQVKDSVTGEVLCGSRAFQSQEEVDAAGGNAVWHETPQQAAEASQRQQVEQPGQRPQPGQPSQQPAPTGRQPQPPQPEHNPDDEDEGTPSPTVPRRR